MEEFKPTEANTPERKSEAAAEERVATPSAAAQFVVEVDDEIDADSMALLLDPELPEGFWMCSTDTLPGIYLEIL